MQLGNFFADAKITCLDQVCSSLVNQYVVLE
jgi:hypothetical protein